MAVQVSYPGVYIEEFAPGAPIEGVGTSTAAFIGPAAKGEINVPRKVTSWDQFKREYGEFPMPGFYLWYAVKGFFENGGQVCYIVRASNGTYDNLVLEDHATSAHDIIRIIARQFGAGVVIKVENPDPLASGGTASELYRPTAEVVSASTAGNIITLNAPGAPSTITAEQQAAQFRPNDLISKNDGSDKVRIVRVVGDQLFVNQDVSPYSSGNPTIRLANLEAGDREFRVQLATSLSLPDDVLVRGAVLTISQGTNSHTGTIENVIAEVLETDTTLTTYRITLREDIGRPFSLDVPVEVKAETFSVEVQQDTTTRTYDRLSTNQEHPRFFQTIINESSSIIRTEIIEPFPATSPPDDLPAIIGAFTNLTPGTLEQLASLNSDRSSYGNAIDSLRRIDDVNLIAIPERVNQAIRLDVITHCEQMGDRFAVLDSDPGLDSTGVTTQRSGLESSMGYAALYYPWLRIPRIEGRGTLLVPPSGHVCGVIARTDIHRGVHKAPANEIINGTLGVEHDLSDIDQGQLNLHENINVIRLFPHRGRPIIWGARTTTRDTNWQYVNVRRLFLFLEESIQEGIEWAVFEPNNTGLWDKLRLSISEFLMRVWRDGALFGKTPEQAFYVRIDEVINPDSERALGRLHIEIGVRPSYPAEFIIVRIGIWRGGSEITEVT